MQSIANCKPSEFLRQTNRIRKSAENWLTVTDILNIRKRLPELEEAKANASDEEKKKVEERNDDRFREQVKKNLSAIFDSVLEEHPEATLEILALCCFVEPENVDDYPVSEYLKAFNELISNKEVIDFFISLVRLGQTNIFAV